MKILNNNFAFLFVIFLTLLSCEKETKDISRITYFPDITVKGEQWQQIPVGGTFTDAGAVATAGSDELPVTTTGTVDVNTPGVYIIEYSAVNSDGFSVKNYRYIGVIDPSVVDTDISGVYKRNAGALGLSTVTKISGNLYRTNNVGGIAAPTDATSVYFYYYNVGEIDVPFQDNGFNEFECIDESISEGVSYSWVVLNSGYGAALRTFVKQ
jgi:hypothetical protein